MFQLSKIWLSKPHMSGKKLDYDHETFKDNWIAPLGPHINTFKAKEYNGK